MVVTSSFVSSISSRAAPSGSAPRSSPSRASVFPVSLSRGGPARAITKLSGPRLPYRFSQLGSPQATSWAMARRSAASPSLPRMAADPPSRSEEHTSELQSPYDLVCRLLLEKKKKKTTKPYLGTTKTQHHI